MVFSSTIGCLPDHVEADPVDDHLLHLNAPCGRGRGARRAIIGTGLGLPAAWMPSGGFRPGAHDPIVRTLWRVNRSGDPTETILANGMPLVEMPMPGRLATTVAIAFPAGARHEAPHEVGVAHLLEHMVFKGSENHRTATELNRAAECLGTELDGSAMQDYVEFGVRGPSRVGDGDNRPADRRVRSGAARSGSSGAGARGDPPGDCRRRGGPWSARRRPDHGGALCRPPARDRHRRQGP